LTLYPVKKEKTFLSGYKSYFSHGKQIRLCLLSAVPLVIFTSRKLLSQILTRKQFATPHGSRTVFLLIKSYITFPGYAIGLIPIYVAHLFAVVF